MVDDVLSIINACLSDDNAAAWNSLIHRFGGIALNILNGKFGDLSRQRKEDIVQNVCLKLVRGGLKNFRGSSKYEFLSYFKTIVINEARTYLKSEMEHSESTSIEEEGEYSEEHGWTLQVPDDRPSPADQVEQNEFIRLIYGALDGVPLEAKQIFLMKAEGHKDKDVADILGVPLGTVASAYSRMKDKLKRLLGE